MHFYPNNNKNKLVIKIVIVVVLCYFSISGVCLVFKAV